MKFENDIQVYELVFDDQKIFVADMKKVIWFSPNLEFEIKGAPLTMGGSWVSSLDCGVQPVDVAPILPWLGACNPGYSECEHPTLTPAFLRNARLNLKKGKRQIHFLERMRVPAALEPVKQHFLDEIEFELEMHRARYAYLQSGDVQALRNLLREQCPRGNTEEQFISTLEKADPAAKLDLSNDWYNEINACRRPKLRYPLQAWQNFLNQFGIQEQYRFLPVD